LIRVARMRIRTVHLDDVRQLPSVDAAVVIDVLRAFTVAPWCYARGAHDVLLAPTLEAAIAGRTRWPNALLLKDGSPDQRFDLPNAPGIIAATNLSGRTVILKTANGTRGAHAALGAAHLFCASFVTAAATARALCELEPRTVALVVTEGDEDVAFADYLSALLSGDDPEPDPYLARAAGSAAAQELRERSHDASFPGVHPDDLELCLQLDRFDFALQAELAGNLLRLERH
jgi:2-phosphosulfolactate phosphatase